jgi:carbon storage regulator CsrA
MLVLSRKLGEKVLVPDLHLSVTVLAVHGKTVRLGFEAPSTVAIVRAKLVRSKSDISKRTDEQSVEVQ